MDPKKMRLEMDSLLETSSGGGNGSGGPFRGKYTRLHGGGGPSSTPGGSRYSPYSISRDRPSPRRSVPLIRARRDEDPAETSSGSLDLNTSSGFGGNSSSTAQKIMETLANMSTPVLNAGRVRIDSVKTMKPMSLGMPTGSMGSILAPTSRFSGPPKTSSPLLLPKTITGVRGSFLGSDNLNWTLRTIGLQPKMIDTATNTDESCIAAEKKGQAQSYQISTQIVPIVANNKTPQIPMGNGISNLTNAATAVKRKYQFGEPWSMNDLMRLKKKKGRKHDELRKDIELLVGEAMSKPKPVMTNGVGDGGGGSGKPKLGVTFSDFKFTPLPISSEKKWECGTCMVRNSPSDEKCVCCETPNPDFKKVEKSTPDKTDSGIKVTTIASSKNWECPTCMVSNKSTANECVCCTEKNPNAVQTETTKSAMAPPTSEFKFGFSSSVPTSTATTSNSFFGSPSTQSASLPKPANDFKFGFKPAASPTPTSSATTLKSDSPAKSFPSATSMTSSPAPFTFGLSATTNKPMASASPIKFGMSSSDEMNKSETVTPITPKKIELWECDVCRHKVKFEIHSCDSCGSPRPSEFDQHYKKPEEKSKSGLKFEPVFGLNRSITQPTSGGFGLPSTTSSDGSSSSTMFGSSTTFSSGNPFGGAGGGGAFGGSNTFGSSTGTTGITSGFGTGGSTTSTTTASAVPAGLFSSSAPPPPYTASSGSQGSSSQGNQFQFGSSTPGSPTKRKLDEKDGSENDPAKKIAIISSATNFSFGGTSTVPALKLKETPTPLFPVAPIAAASPSPASNAGFLEALKNASAAVKASSEKQSNTVTSTSGPAATKMFTFGTAGPAPTGTTNSVGGGAPPGGFFGAPNPSSGFSFGSSAGTFSSQPMGFNQTNPQPAIAPVAPATPAPAAAQFNLTPNFNFGASAPAAATTFSFGAAPSTGAAGGAAAAPFQFSATPTSGSIVGERKIRKAARRFK